MADFHVMRLTPDAGPIKTRQTRIVPIHERIIEQGYLDMVRRVGSAWQHTFKQRAARNGIAENVHDEITGHAPASEGRKYTTPTVEDMAAALKKFPRYDVEGPPGSRRGETKKRAPSSAVGKSNNGNRVSRRRNHNDRFA